MSQAKKNILNNPNVCLAVYDSKSAFGYKAFGKAKYYDSDKYLDIAKKRLAGEPYQAKGAVVIKIDKIFKIA